MIKVFKGVAANEGGRQKKLLEKDRNVPLRSQLELKELKELKELRGW
jgi:hypothetical protein